MAFTMQPTINIAEVILVSKVTNKGDRANVLKLTTDIKFKLVVTNNPVNNYQLYTTNMKIRLFFV